MTKEVMIIGASGHGKVIADIIQKSGDKVFGFIDDEKSKGGTFAGFPILGKVEDYCAYLDKECIIAIGDNIARAKVSEKIKAMAGGETRGVFYTAIHPSAVISNIDVKIGEGTVIMANAVINPGAHIGCHCIINTTAVVEHDNMIADFVHISVGAKLAGTVSVGEKTMIGAGAVVKNNTDVGSKSIVGAGTVVIKDVPDHCTVVGNPARVIKE